MNIKKEVLKAQESLIKIKKGTNSLIVKAKFGPSKEIRIPLILDENLAFFVATIIGDGHLKKSKYQIALELSNKRLLTDIQKVCMQLFKKKFNIWPTKIREGKKPTYRLNIDSKAVYSLLTEVFSVPKGKKSSIVQVPKIITKSNKSIKSAFLIGLMTTEGGKRRRGFGLSTSSEILWKQLVNLFTEIGIKIFKDKWINKKYNRYYYGLMFKKDQLNLLTTACKNRKINEVLTEIILF